MSHNIPPSTSTHVTKLSYKFHQNPLSSLRGVALTRNKDRWTDRQGGTNYKCNINYTNLNVIEIAN